MQESGNLALAAHRLARARCRVFGGSDGIPTLREVMAAARMIANHVPEHPEPPSPSVVGAEVRELCISDFPPRR